MAATERRGRLQTHTERVPSGCGCPGCVRVVDHAPRCWNCSRPLIEVTGRPWAKKCDACKARNHSPPEERMCP